MKKTFFTLVLLAGLSGAAQAQRNYYESPVFAGLKAGGSISTLQGTAVRNSKDIYGFHLGALLSIGLSRHFSVQPELLYSQKGGKLIAYSGQEATRRFHYIDVPVAVHGRIGSVFAELGPQLSVLVTANETTSDASTSISDNYNLLDIGYVAGFGYQPKTGFGVGLRYNGPFISSAKAVEISSGNGKTQLNIRHSVVQLYVNYLFKNRR